MKNLTQLFAAELSKKIDLPNSFAKTDKTKVFKGRNLLKSAPAIQLSQTILQLSAIPLKIDLNEFKNPHSYDNPTGDYKAAYRFAALANIIPNLTPYFEDSLNQVTDVWENIIHSAVSDTLYTKNVIYKAKQKFNFSAMSGMAGIPENWYPVYSNPNNWYHIILDDSNLIKIELDIQSGQTDNNDFIVLDQNASFTWKVNNKENVIHLNPNGSIKKIYLSILKVDFVRPWFDFELLNLQNWKIDGLGPGYYSNGSLDLNRGIFPLITQSMLVGTQISVEGDFSTNDIHELNKITNAGKNLSLGTFLMNEQGQNVALSSKDGNTIITSNVKQVIGYISRLIPLSPSLPKI